MSDSLEKGGRVLRIRLTIADQPLVLTPKEAAVLFGEHRLRQFAEGVWTPWVFCEPELPAGQEYVARHYDLSAMSDEELERFFRETLPQSSAARFADEVMAAATAEDIEA
jgi:hypothetical protein